MEQYKNPSRVYSGLGLGANIKIAVSNRQSTLADDASAVLNAGRKVVRASRQDSHVWESCLCFREPMIAEQTLIIIRWRNKNCHGP